MAIEHDFFGLLASGADGSIMWSENIELGDQIVSVSLTSPDQDDVAPDALDAAASMVSTLPAFDLTARDAMLRETDDRASDVTEFILRQQDTLGDTLQHFLVDNSGDLPVDVIRSLTLMSVTVLADAYEWNEPFAVFEFALDPDETEEVLLVNFAFDGSVLTVTSGE